MIGPPRDVAPDENNRDERRKPIMTMFSDETVMRYVDGELDDETSARLEAALARDSELSQRIELFASTRLAAQDALRPLLDEPVPAELTAAVEAMAAKAKTSASAAPPGSRSKWRLLTAANDDWRRLAAAACIAGILGVGAGFLAGNRDDANGVQLVGVDKQALAAALVNVPAGGTSDLPGEATRFRAIASFHDNRQSLCREFEIDMRDNSKLTSVACAEGTSWIVRFAVNAPGGSGGYAPASSAEALEAYLSAINAEPPLNATDEKTALEKLAPAME